MRSRTSAIGVRSRSMTAIRRSSAPSASPLSIDCVASATPSLRSLRLPATISAAAALNRRRRGYGAGLALEHRLQRVRVGVGVAAAQASGLTRAAARPPPA